MKLSLNFFIFFIFIGYATIQSQTITVNDSGFTPQALVDLLLSSSCSTNSNISISSSQSVAYFNNNSSSFPIPEGIIIRNGIAANSQGVYTGMGLDSQVNTNGDADLQNISNQSGQSSTITDVAFLEFDFVPSSTNFTFDFLFASNEYGQWQCGFSDVFAFLLTDLNTGVTTNLSVIPGTNTPISVRNIRDNQYNTSCSSINPQLFDTYNVNTPANSTLNMRGHTVVLNASSPVIPNNPYRIKLAIGDYNDSSFDSAVFIQAGSFDTFLNLGDDREICDGDSILFDTGFTDTVNFSYEWTRNSVPIAGETNPTYTAIEAGTYDVTVTTLSSGCTLTDQIVITDLLVTSPNDLLECDMGSTTTFDLTRNDATTLGIDPADYEIFYYASLTDANNNTPITTNLITYSSTGGQTIYIKLRNRSTNNFCVLTLEFDLNVVIVNATTPTDIEACESDTIINFPNRVGTQILNGADPADYTITYYTSQFDANNETNEIPDPTNFILPTGVNPISIWIRLIENVNPTCFDITTFNINVNPSPPVDVLSTAYRCTEYTLPALTNGNYFTGSGGTGNALNPGDIVTDQTVIFIYNTNANGCSNESSFAIFMADEFSLNTQYCGQFIVPFYPDSEFYTAPGGPTGTGTLIPAATIINTDQTIYFYSEPQGIFCVEDQFDISILPIPPVDEFDDVITCDSYTLLPTVNGDYFTEQNGGGIPLNPGDAITSSQTIHLLYIDPMTNCINRSQFEVTIIDTIVFQDVSVCGSYTIPSVALGGYYNQPEGNDPIPEGTIINSSQSIYYYASEVTLPINCTDNIEIEVTINTLPPVDQLNNILRCEDSPPVLPVLTNGQYFTESGGMGTQLNAGDIITNSQRIYVYNTNTFCDAETFFDIEIRSLPLVDNFTDVFSCDPYTLPALTDGQYFTAANGLGTQMNAGDIISTTQTLYIFNEYADLAGCVNENVFIVNILGVHVDELADVANCDMYELPTLTVGDYFTESGGMGTQLNAGDMITATQTLFIYAENGDRFLCTDEHTFTITITDRPSSLINSFLDLEGCTNVMLPTLNIPGVQIEYYREPSQVNLIAPSEYTVTTIGSQTIYVHAYATENSTCAIETSFQVTVYPLLDLEIDGGTICINTETNEVVKPFLLESGLDPNIFTVNWYLEGLQVGSGPNYNALEAGTYTAETIKLTNDIGPDCNYNPTEIVVTSSTPVFKIDFLTNDFVEFYTIEVNVIDPGLGNYEFSLNDGTFQNSIRFYNIPPGKHTITVKDLSGLCGDFVLEFIALDYPKFFTPNGDGINDTWNIEDLKNNPQATIKIFTRLGRLIKTIKPSEQGWNGFNNNGKSESSTDYWFVVEYLRNGILTNFKGNFSLLRR